MVTKLDYETYSGFHIIATGQRRFMADKTQSGAE
jgi:hypothetical protein